MEQPSDGWAQIAVVHSEINATNTISESRQDCVAIETAIALSYNGISHAVMLATPLDLRDFALGFSLAEGIVTSVDQIFDFDVQTHPNGLELALEISSDRFHSLKERRRTLMGTTGCGLCGQDSLDTFDIAAQTRALSDSKTPTAAYPIVSPQAISQALAELPKRQSLFKKTGGVHAAAWVCLSNGLQLVREDVGRHNALDKLVGALSFQGVSPRSGFIVCTSRASYEMVFKAQRFGALALVCVSAPTLKAIEFAQQSGLGLAGFARGQKIMIYANASRFGCDAG